MFENGKIHMFVYLDVSADYTPAGILYVRDFI